MLVGGFGGDGGGRADAGVDHVEREAAVGAAQLGRLGGPAALQDDRAGDGLTVLVDDLACNRELRRDVDREPGAGRAGHRVRTGARDGRLAALAARGARACGVVTGAPGDQRGDGGRQTGPRRGGSKERSHTSHVPHFHGAHEHHPLPPGEGVPAGHA